MIPITEMVDDTEEVEATKQHKLIMSEISDNRILGDCDNIEALKQAVFKLLNTDRYTYPIYSWDYGVQFSDLIGEDIDFVKSEIKRRVTEALLKDDRITEVTDFTFTEGASSLIVKLNVNSIYGNFDSERVIYNV